VSIDLAALSPREDQVIRLMAQGFSAKEIARVVGASPRTVERHIDNMRAKLDARNGPHLVARAFMLGMLRPPLEASSTATNDNQRPPLRPSRLRRVPSLCVVAAAFSPPHDRPLDVNLVL
jgi:DNA-binding CsgD family transcriptional regulator